MRDLAHHDGSDGGVLIVVPTLNEAAHAGGVIDSLRPFLGRAAAAARPVLVVVADGGSSDATRGIVAAHPLAGEGRLLLLNNPARLQGAAVNLAVARHGDGMDWLIRLDAHAFYPDDYCDILLEEARDTGADSVVVAMRAVAETPFQRAVAPAQNGRFGNGGAAHRGAGARGALVDHGHHALIRLAAFRTAGGYDASFSHNEDAELDHRLLAQGGRIWLTRRTWLDYLPRRSLPALARQYFNFGRGRARTLQKHRLRPRVRQLVVICLLPALSLALLAPVHPAFALPAALWIAGCLAAGLSLALGGGHGRNGLAAGALAGVMHLAWSVGFWSALAGGRPALATAAQPLETGRPARIER